jgi:hypothetical protein
LFRDFNIHVTNFEFVETLLLQAQSLKNNIIKKRNLQTLKLNKKTISTFELEEVKGGVTPIATWMYSEILPVRKKRKVIIYL